MDEKNKYIYHEDKDLYILADLHGRFDLLINEIQKKQYINSVLIIAGDIGVGFKKHDFYNEIFNELNKILEKNNTYVYAIRGNHDDPSYFHNEKFSFNYFKLIDDYSIIQIGNKKILCVGGALSIDRKYRIEEYLYRKEFMHQFNSLSNDIYPSYWKDEMPIFDLEKLNDISKYCKVNYVVTHTSPHFAFKNDKNGLDYWMKLDPKLNEDLDKERNIITNLYKKLVSDGHPIIKWIYGHFHNHNEEKIGDINFIALSNFDRTNEIIKIK